MRSKTKRGDVRQIAMASKRKVAACLVPPAPLLASESRIASVLAGAFSAQRLLLGLTGGKAFQLDTQTSMTKAHLEQKHNSGQKHTPHTRSQNAELDSCVVGPARPSFECGLKSAVHLGTLLRARSRTYTARHGPSRTSHLFTISPCGTSETVTASTARSSTERKSCPTLSSVCGFIIKNFPAEDLEGFAVEEARQTLAVRKISVDPKRKTMPSKADRIFASTSTV